MITQRFVLVTLMLFGQTVTAQDRDLTTVFNCIDGRTFDDPVGHVDNAIAKLLTQRTFVGLVATLEMPAQDQVSIFFDSEEVVATHVAVIEDARLVEIIISKDHPGLACIVKQGIATRVEPIEN